VLGKDLAVLAAVLTFELEGLWIEDVAVYQNRYVDAN
jgi:hypothetical protein